MVISTGLMEAGLKSDFFSTLSATDVYWKDLTTVIDSTTKVEHYRFLGQAPFPREMGNGRVAKGLRSESYSVENAEYESTIEADRSEVEDDQLGQIRMRVNEMAMRCQQFKDYMVEQLLIHGADEGYNSYDGVTFFNAAHVSGQSGEQSNITTPAAADGTSPSVAEFKASFASAVARLISFLDDTGQPLRPAPKGLVAIVPTDMMFTAMEALSATLLNNTSNILQGAARVFTMPGLPNEGAWYLAKVEGVAVRPLIFQKRVPLEFSTLDTDSEHSFKSGKLLFGTRERFRMTYGYWQNIIKVQFT